CNSIDRSTLRTSTPDGTSSTTGAKLRMLVTPADTRRSQTACAAPAGVAITPIATESRTTTDSISSAGRTTCRAILLPTTSGSESNSAAIRNPREANPAVMAQGTTQIAGADDDDRPVLGQAEFPGDLVHQVLNVVTHAPGAVGAQLRQVLTELGRVHPRRGGEFLARHGGDLTVGQRVQRPEVDRQTGDSRLRDALDSVG